MNQETNEVGVVLSIIALHDGWTPESIARIVWMMSGAIEIEPDGRIWSPISAGEDTVVIDPNIAREARTLLGDPRAWRRLDHRLAHR